MNYWGESSNPDLKNGESSRNESGIKVLVSLNVGAEPLMDSCLKEVALYTLVILCCYAYLGHMDNVDKYLLKYLSEIESSGFFTFQYIDEEGITKQGSHKLSPVIKKLSNYRAAVHH